MMAWAAKAERAGSNANAGSWTGGWGRLFVIAAKVQCAQVVVTIGTETERESVKNKTFAETQGLMQLRVHAMMR